MLMPKKKCSGALPWLLLGMTSAFLVAIGICAVKKKCKSAEKAIADCLCEKSTCPSEQDSDN